MKQKPLSSCRLCRANDLVTVFDLGELALCGRFPAADEPDVPKAPLELVRCSDCGLVQLGHEFRLDELYGDTYGYRSGINETMRRHLRGIATIAAEIVDLRPGDTVLDIASNDGTLLSSYAMEGLVRIGIDPTIALFAEHYPPGVLKAADFFSASRFREISPVCNAKVVTSIAVLYDLPDPNKFVADIADILTDDGVWIFEQSDLGAMLTVNAFDTICHEHLEYYAFSQIERLVEGNGLRIFDAVNNSSNGGSLRVFACRRSAPHRTNRTNLDRVRVRERELDLEELSPLNEFRARCARARDQLRNFLYEEKAKGRTIHIYGASTKGNTLLQYCGIGAEIIDVACERNSWKWGRRTPGTGIPIVSEEESRAAHPDYLLVLPWHFRDEFIEREAAYIEQGGKFVFPLPSFEVYPGVH